MNLLSVISTKLKSMAWKKPSQTTLTVKKVDQPQYDMLYNKIIIKLCRYIDGIITLKEFSDWFIPIAWEIDPNDKQANKLVYSIKILFSEYSKGNWTKEYFRERLIDLVL